MGRRRRAWLVNGNGRRPGRPGFYVGWHEWGLDGRRINRSRHFDSIEHARLFVERHNAKRDLQLTDQVSRISIVDAGDEFIRGCMALRKSTRIGYRAAIARLTIHGPAILAETTGRHIDRFIAARSATASAATVAQDIRSLRRFFNWAVKNQHMASNPIEDATSRPRDRHARARPFIDDTRIGKLVESLATDDRRVAVWLAMTTGLDRKVIENLRADQVDIGSKVIRLRRPKTGAIVTVPLHPLLLPELERRIAHTSVGKPLLRGLTHQRRDEDWWHRAREAVGLPKLLFRDLRAVASSRLLDAGVSLPDVQRLLGHASLETTAAHYVMPSGRAASTLASLPLPGHPDNAKSNTG